LSEKEGAGRKAKRPRRKEVTGGPEIQKNLKRNSGKTRRGTGNGKKLGELKGKPDNKGKTKQVTGSRGVGSQSKRRRGHQEDGGGCLWGIKRKRRAMGGGFQNGRAGRLRKKKQVGRSNHGGGGGERGLGHPKSKGGHWRGKGKGGGTLKNSVIVKKHNEVCIHYMARGGGNNRFGGTAKPSTRRNWGEGLGCDARGPDCHRERDKKHQQHGGKERHEGIIYGSNGTTTTELRVRGRDHTQTR